MTQLRHKYSLIKYGIYQDENLNKILNRLILQKASIIYHSKF